MTRLARAWRGTGAVLGAIALTMLSTPASASSDMAAAHAQVSVALAIDSVTPSAPRPDGKVTISGRVRVSGRAATGLTVLLRYSTVPLADRDGLRTFAAGPSRTSDPPLIAARSALRTRTGRWHFTMPVARFGDPATLAVYPISVDVVDSGGTPLAEKRTFLPVSTAKPVHRRTRIAWLWPVIDRPHQAEDGTIIGTGLRRELAPDGRLGRLVHIPRKLADKVPLTWVVDPSIVDDAALLSRSHRVLRKGRTTTAAGSAAGTRWLHSLDSAIGSAPVAVTPYADPDVAALTRVGMERDVRGQVRGGAALVRKTLHKKVTGRLGWPIGGLADNDVVDAYAFGGAHTVVLSTATLPTDTSAGDVARGAARMASSDGKLRLLLADDTLTRVLGEAGSAAGIRQRFLAETALVTRGDSAGATIVVAPPQRWSPSSALVDGLLHDSASAPWLRPVSTHSLHGGTALDQQLAYPSHARDAELGRHYLSTVRAIRTQAGRLATALSGTDDPFALAVARLESSAWRDRQEAGFHTRNRVKHAITKQTGQIHFINRASITLSGSKADIPIVIANDNTDRAATVRVVVRAPKNHQLSIGSYREQQTIGPGQKIKFKVPVQARAVGVSELSLKIETVQGKTIGMPVPLKIRVTDLGSTATWITAVAVGVIVLAIAWRALRRRSSGPPEGDGTDHEPPDGDTEASAEAAGGPAKPAPRGGYPYRPDPSDPPVHPRQDAAERDPDIRPPWTTDPATEARG